MHAPSSRTVRTGLAGAGLLAMCGIAFGSLASSALFTSSASTGSATVASGNVAIGLGGSGSTALAVSAMAPGDTRYGIVTLTNTGSLQARVASKATWSQSNALTQALSLSVRQITNGSTTCDATLGWGTGDIISNQVAGVGITTIPVYGSATTGQQPGDRTVSAAGVETYCARLTLPVATGNAAASLTSDLTFTFDAEQTANT